jgi:hypothetical protein
MRIRARGDIRHQGAAGKPDIGAGSAPLQVAHIVFVMALEVDGRSLQQICQRLGVATPGRGADWPLVGQRQRESRVGCTRISGALKLSTLDGRPRNAKDSTFDARMPSLKIRVNARLWM